MTFALTQILEKESARLLRKTAELFEPVCLSSDEVDTSGLFSLASQSRAMVTEILQRHIETLSNDDLIKLQSSLHSVLDDQIGRLLAKLYERRVQAINEQARRDSLTGLMNRAAFEDRLIAEVARAQRYQRDLSVVMFDVDNFKSVNDGFGHQAGDRVLALVAGVLQSSFRQSDAVFRYGGDEFMAICPETSGQAMKTVLQRLDVNLQSMPELVESARPIGISWGCASFPDDGTEAGGLIRVADGRLYLCKRERHQKLAAGL